ncbi:GIY-YIG nuclease family protein [Candidatus Saccharibacteria bacterium]|nr:GIY-YIG nuclease family protein [Candidatus Saccharibacteria bacterium]MCB9821092.1 GIY-YIG nuclease family protein [Candidatus Nomurabacteria bacterium]
MFYVYVIFNKIASKIYIGQTQNIKARLLAHNNKHKTKSFTSKFEGEWELIYKESFTTRSEAIQRERSLKSAKGREYVKQFIPG